MNNLEEIVKELKRLQREYEVHLLDMVEFHIHIIVDSKDDENNLVDIKRKLHIKNSKNE